MVEEVLEHFQNNPRTSTRVAANDLHLSHTTVWQVLYDNHQHPYHLQRVQGLHAAYYPLQVVLNLPDGLYKKIWNNLVLHLKCSSLMRHNSREKEYLTCIINTFGVSIILTLHKRGVIKYDSLSMFGRAFFMT
ncbi:Uncharacterised protein at_DN2281 [Pycnogonum litorale]